MLPRSPHCGSPGLGSQSGFVVLVNGVFCSLFLRNNNDHFLVTPGGSRDALLCTHSGILARSCGRGNPLSHCWNAQSRRYEMFMLYLNFHGTGMQTRSFKGQTASKHSFLCISSICDNNNVDFKHFRCLNWNFYLRWIRYKSTDLFLPYWCMFFL